MGIVPSLEDDDELEEEALDLRCFLPSTIRLASIELIGIVAGSLKSPGNCFSVVLFVA
jgi:hypothetical protein